MPPYYKKRSNNYKKVYRRRARGYSSRRGGVFRRRRSYGSTRPLTKIKISNTILADETWTKLNLWWDDFLIADDEAPTPYIATNYMAGNDIYQPLGDTSFQPTGWNEWGSMYKRFYVAGSKMTLEVVNTSRSQSVPTQACPSVTLLPKPNSALSSLSFTTKRAQEYPYAQTKVLAGPSAGGTTKFKAYMTTNKMFGKTGTKIDDQFSGQTESGVPASPLQYWWWNIILDSSADGANSQMTFSAKVTYYVKFYDRVDLAIS